MPINLKQCIPAVKVLKKWATVVSIIVPTTLLILCLLGLLVIGTETGRIWLIKNSIQFANSRLVHQEKPLRAELKHIRSPSIDYYRFGEITATQSGKPWITATGIQLQLNLRDIVSGKISLPKISAQQLHYTHTRQSVETPKKDNRNTPNWPSKIPKLPLLNLPNISIDQLTVKNLLSTATSEKNNPELQYRVKATLLSDAQHPVNATLQAQPLIERLPDISIKVNAQSNQSLELTAQVVDTNNGRLSHFLQLPNGEVFVANIRAQLKSQLSGYTAEFTEFTLPLLGHNFSLTGELAFKKPNFTQINNARDQQPWVLTTQNTTIDVDGQVQRLQLELTPNSIAASAALESFPIDIVQFWLPNNPWPFNNSKLSGKFELKESLQNPRYTFDSHLQFDYLQKPWQVKTIGSGNLNGVKLKRLEAKERTGDKPAMAQADGSIFWDDSNNNLNWDIRNISSDSAKYYYPSLPMPESLTLFIDSANGKLSGTLKNPKIQTTLEVNGNYKNIDFNTAADLRVEDTLIEFYKLNIRLPEGYAKIMGQFDWDKQLANGNLHLEEFPIQLVNTFGDFIPASVQATSNGDAEFTGTLKSPKVNANLSLAGMAERIPFKTEAVFDYQHKALQVSTLRLDAYQKTVLELSGSYADNVMDFELVADHLPSELLDAYAVKLPFNNLTSRVNVQGSLPDLAIDGFVNLDADFKYKDSDGNPAVKPVTIKTLLATHDGLFSVSSTVEDKQLPGSLSNSYLNAALPLSKYLNYALNSQQPSIQTMPIDLKLAAQMDLSSLSFLLDTESNQLKGNTKIDLKLDGFLNNPKLAGRASVADINYFNPTTGTRLTNGNCAITATKTLVSLERCSADDGRTGRYDLKGNIDLNDNLTESKIDLTMQVDNVSLLRRPDIENETNGEIRVTGNLKSLLAKGDLNVSPLDAIVDINFGKSTPTLNVTEIHDNQPQSNTTSAFPTPEVNLDIRLIADQQAYVRGRGLEAELGGAVTLRGTLNNPNYKGEFNTVRGSFEVFTRKFILQNGKINFVNDSIALQVAGVYKNRERTIRAEIVGSNENYTLTLSSIPTLPEDEILSYLIFGESVQNISPIKAIQLAAAIQTLRGGDGTFFDPIGFTRETLGVDTLSVDQQTTDEGQSGLNVGVGKYLNDRVYLEVERTPSTSQPWKGSIEIELTPRINLQSTTGGNSGIDSAEIIWSNDY